jgi:MFS family permease
VAQARRKGAMRAALRHRDFRFLIAGQAVSGTGDWLYNVALIVYILSVTHSAAWVAAASIARLLPYSLFGTFGGDIADRYDRKKVMIAADVARGVVMAGLTVVAGVRGPAIAAMLLATASTIFSAAYSPCVSASTPLLVGEDDLTAANAIIAAVENVTLALGPMVGGILLLLGSPTTAFAVNALTFVVSAALTIPIRTRLTSTAGHEQQTSRTPMLERLGAGFREIRSSPDVVLLGGFAVALSFCYGQEIILYALTATHLLHTGGDGIAFMYAAIGVGGIFAAALTGRVTEGRRQGAILAVGGFVSGIPLITLAFVRTPAIAYVLLALEGAGVIVCDVIVITVLQRIVNPDIMGRVFGILDSLMVAGMLLGSLVAPVLVGAIGLPASLVVAGSLLLVFTVLTLPRARAIDRRAVERVREIGPRLRLLQGLGIFEGATRQTLEALAAAMERELVGAGEVVIHEGDEPDDLFIVEEGSLEVTASGGGELPEGTRVGELGPGDYFGEIGLLRRIPRTATVATVTDSRLYRMSGEDFLEIVNAGPRISVSLVAGVAARMARTRPTEEFGHA